MFLVFRLIVCILFIIFLCFSSYSKSFKLNVSIPFITLLDKKIDKKTLDNFEILLKNELKKNSKISFIELDLDFYSENILNFDKLNSLFLDKSIDFIISGSITKFKFGILFNLKVMNTVNSNILFNKQYIINQYSLKEFINEFNNDLNKVLNENIDYVFNLEEGKSEIRVNTLPKSASVSLNGNLISKTPLIIKGVKDDINKLEIYNEEELLVKSLSIKSHNEKMFFAKINGKEYLTSLAEIREEKDDNYNIELYSSLDNIKNKRQKNKNFFKLEIVTEPENLKVYLNNKLIGNSPIIIDNLIEGQHNLKIQKNRTIVFNEIINSKIEPKKFLNIHLYKLSKVYLESKPSQATIYIDNIYFGLTPKYINIPFGYHMISVNKSGFNSLNKEIFINYPESMNLSLELESLKNIDTSVSFFPTAITENFLNLNIFALSLGQLSDDNNFTKNLAYSYGTELNYGINSVFRNEYFSLGGQIGIFYNNFGLFSNNFISSNYGLAGKIKFLEQNNIIPVSVAIGGFYRLNNGLNNYIVMTRDFDWAYLSLGAHFKKWKINSVNFNFSIKNFNKINVGLVALIDFGLNANVNQYLAPLIGINLGYNFI
jgi:hypothetical protein